MRLLEGQKHYHNVSGHLFRAARSDVVVHRNQFNHKDFRLSRGERILEPPTSRTRTGISILAEMQRGLGVGGGYVKRSSFARQCNPSQGFSRIRGTWVTKRYGRYSGNFSFSNQIPVQLTPISLLLPRTTIHKRVSPDGHH